MDLSTGVQRILDGEAVLFVGTGFSIGAANLREKFFLSRHAIADYFFNWLLESQRNAVSVPFSGFVKPGLITYMDKV